MKKINNRGQALVEYVVIIGLVTVLVVGLVSYFGGYLKDAMTKTGCQLMGEDYEAGEKIGEGKCVSSGDSLEDMFK